MKNNPFPLLATIVLFIVLIGCGSKSTNSQDSKETAEKANDQKFEDSKIKGDTEFAVAAADGGMLEVQLGKLAQTNARSSKVKAFGKMMVEDHSKANEELKAVAQQKNISLPATLSEKNQRDYDDLAKKSGKEFDEAYTDFMVKDHKDDIDEFKKQADKGDDVDLKSWASGKISVLEHHLEMAKNAEKAVKENK